MRRTRSLLLAASLVASALPASAQVSLFPIPRVGQQAISFEWSGPIEGAAQALAAQLGYRQWTTMASGLPIPNPPPSVAVSIRVTGVSPAEIVVRMNQQAANRAIVVLDPDKRFVQVVYYG